MPPRLNRRSFIGQVVGVTAVGGGALSLVLGKSFAQETRSRTCLTDTDSTDRPDYGARTGLTDTDTTDSAGRGTLTQHTDTDSFDRANRGRSWRCANATHTGVTDNDSGASADRSGYGRGGSGRNGVSDHDTSDRAGNGRGNTGASDNDSGPNGDRAGYGRGRGHTGVSDQDPTDVAGAGRGGGRPNTTGFPDFPWPPPRPTEAPLKLPHGRIVAALGADKSLYAVGQHLTGALTRAGYAEFTYYGVPDGFALVSRLERIEADGRPSPNGFRYMPPGQEPFSLTAYLSGLFVAPVGRYRQIVFVVTDVPVVASGPALTQRRAGELLREGADRLPADFRQIPFGNDHDVTALIYEFEKTGQVGHMRQLDTGPLSASDHLTRSGLYAAILSR